MKNNKLGFRSLFVFIAFVSAVFIVLLNSFAVIPTGYTGVRITFGQIDEKTVGNGLNRKLPFVQKIEKINNKQQDITFDTAVWSETAARTAMYYSGITVTYNINPKKSAWIYANVSNYSNLISVSLLSSSLKSVSKVLTDEDATNRSVIEPLVLENLQNSLDEKYGENTVIVHKVNILEADFEDEYNQAISEKQSAQIAAEKQAIINQQNIDAAEAEAEVKRIQAQAEADANSLLEQSLTDNILKEQYIEKWNGQLPNVVSGENDSLMLNVNN